MADSASAFDDAQRRALGAFAVRHGFVPATPGASLPLSGALDGIAMVLSRPNRGTMTNACWVTRFVATAPFALPGGLVAYKPNFRWRLPGPRRVSDSLGVSGLLGFVHHDPIGDPALDRALVMFADEPAVAAALLRAPAVRAAILEALARAGHLRIEGSQVAIEVPERRGGVLAPFASPDEVEQLARAATTLVRALCDAAHAAYRG